MSIFLNKTIEPIYITFSVSCRIRSDVDGWCPTKKIAMNASEYIELDLGHLTVVTLIELQGRFSVKPVRNFSLMIDSTESNREREHRMNNMRKLSVWNIVVK